ncbi:MAG: nucleotidyltransferase domain-containing protein [Armatimonadota bacterium]
MIIHQDALKGRDHLNIAEKQLSVIIQRIVNSVRPIRIVSYDPVACGETSTGSDLNILVVMPEGANKHQIIACIRKQLINISIVVNILVATPLLIENHRNNSRNIYRMILVEGRELYNAQAFVH